MESSGQENEFTPINRKHSIIKQDLDTCEVKPTSKKRASSIDQEASGTQRKKQSSVNRKEFPPSAPSSDQDTDSESQDMAGKVKADDVPLTPKKKVVAARIKTEQPEARKGSRTHKQPHVKSIIPTCWEEASAADRMLVTMKGKGAEWGNIRESWKEMTGQDTAIGTLPSRYTRVKANLMRLEEGDAERLRDAKYQVEAKFQVEKFHLIADAIEKAGGAKYSTLFIAKEIKKMGKVRKDPATAGDGGMKEVEEE